jgi:hypothetical protein
MGADRWSSFRAYASKALSKPTFELEERLPRLQVAAELLDALESARERDDWVTRLRSCLFARSYPAADLTSREQNESFAGWLSSGDPGLASALAAFREGNLDELGRFAAFASAAGAAQNEGRMPSDPGVVLAFGSLFNFATEPARLPFVLAHPFRNLEELLGHDAEPDESVSDSYRRHLTFARALEAELGTAGVPVRDMLDVQSLIFDASRNAAFWYEPPEGESLEQGSAAARRSPAKPPSYLSVCAIYRDEASYLREWIEFHRLVGVERFFLYDNRSVDDHLEVLGPYVDEGTVVLHDWPMPQGQLPAYEHCIGEHGRESRWIAFIDLDEFLFSPTGRALPEVLVEYEKWPAVGANWAVFGPSGHVRRPPGLVTENYVERLDVAANKTIKSVVDPSRVTRFLGVHRFGYDRLGTVDENHYPIFGGQTKSVSFERLRINHYFTKSVEEYRERSSRIRPDPAMVEREFDPARLSRWEEVAERDEVILQYLPALRRALTE